MGNGPKSRTRRAGKRGKKTNRRGGKKNMPQMWIEMTPEKFRFRERGTGRELGEEIEGDVGHMDWERFLQKVEDNPMWVTSYKLGCSMDAIWDSYYDAKEEETNIMVLAEEDWKNWKEACENPKVLTMTQRGPEHMPGWGIHPRLNRQMLCFPRAVIKATDKDPREEAKKAAAEAAVAAKALEDAGQPPEVVNAKPKEEAAA